MPTQIRATCPACGDVDLTVADVTLEVGRGVVLEDPLAVGRYRYQCPTCAAPVRREAQWYVVQMLLASGVAVDRPDPVRPSLRPEQRGVAPLGADDVARACRLLEAPFTVEDFVGRR